MDKKYVLGPFLKHNNYLTRTNEQLVRKLDKYLEDAKDRLGDTSKNWFADLVTPFLSDASFWRV